jgi:hypothetical protein
MGHAGCHDDQLSDHPRDPEHPVVAVVAVIAIVAAMLLIAWARVAVHGTEDIEAAISDAPTVDYRPSEERQVDAAVTSSRFATGFSP